MDANDNARVTVRKISNLLLPAVDGVTDFTQRLNPDSMKVVTAVAESSLKSAPVGARFQFMRSGYFVVDKNTTPDNVVFNEIVELKDSFNNK